MKKIFVVVDPDGEVSFGSSSYEKALNILKEFIEQSEPDILEDWDCYYHIAEVTIYD